VKFEWDSEKDKTNRQKHKVTFLEACYIFADKYMLTFYDEEHSDDEDRWITIGQSVNSKILVVIHNIEKLKVKNPSGLFQRGRQQSMKRNSISKGEVDIMKKEYDFSKAEQGKFYRPLEKLEIPVYLDKEVKDFFSKTASKKKIRLDKIVNTILRKEMEMLKAIGV
jgi:uncharacterized DUF497 family protein